MSKIGILDIKGENINPLNGKIYSEQYRTLAQKWSKLPAYEKTNEIVGSIKKNSVLLITSGTGSGKTVMIPKQCLHAFDYNGKIAITMPKKIIVQSASEYAAATLDVELGEEVGYKFKGSNKKYYSEKTKLLYSTDGTILSMILKDPLLSELNAVIIDEAHEMSVNIVLLIYLLRNVVEKRKDFKLIIMSATIDTKNFKNYFNDVTFEMLNISGKPNFPVKSIYSEYDIPREKYIEEGFKIIEKILEDDKITPNNENESHDILFFATTINETFKICSHINSHSSSENLCIEVYSGMDEIKQNLAQDREKYKEIPQKKRKIIIATNVAESSLTIDGIKFVVDSGFELKNYYDFKLKCDVLKVDHISHAQAMQRMGRTGRTEPGTCYHLYTKDTFENKMKKFPDPEIVKVDLTQICLKLLNLPTIKNTIDLKKTILHFLVYPPEENIDYCIYKLLKMEFITDNAINARGKVALDINVNLNSVNALLLAYKLNCVNEMSIIVSLIEELKGTVLDVFQLDFLVGEKNNTYLLNKFINGVIQNNKFSNKFGDLIGFINLFTKYKAIKREDIKDFCYEYFLKCETMRRVNEHNFKLKRKLYDLLKNNHFFDDKVNNKFRESSLNTKIIAAFTYGYMFNIGIFEKGYVNNDKIRNISINKLSFFNKTDKKKGVVVYQNVLNINGDFNCNMLTYVPKKSMEIIDNVLPDLKTKSNS